MNIWTQLPKPFFVLAPMDDVTDTVFRQIIAQAAAPDLFFTEFVSADGLQSAGREALAQKLAYSRHERPLIAQIWGTKPNNFRESAQQIASLGFDGIDLNMGCPVRNVVKNGACSALINNRELAAEIIAATKAGAGSLPVSIKTRLGTTAPDMSWLQFLLEQEIAALSIHLRTVKELSKTAAHWELMPQILQLRDRVAPQTLIVGNGDVNNRAHGMELLDACGCDGIMIGRGVLHDLFAFAKAPATGLNPVANTAADREGLLWYHRHIELFLKTHGTQRNPESLKKFAKLYVNGFEGASELRHQLMQAESAEALLDMLRSRVPGSVPV